MPTYKCQTDGCENDAAEGWFLCKDCNRKEEERKLEVTKRRRERMARRAK